jgi:phage tail sheath protein FI
MKQVPNETLNKIDTRFTSTERYLQYLEQAITKAISWTAFETNNESLWSRVRMEITDFLTSEWRIGHMQGTSPEQAFFARCDRTTMTQNDIDQGILICVIGVALVKPAEFSIIKVTQRTK